jgi:hypothetical protein
MGLYPKSKPAKDFTPEIIEEVKPEKHFEKIDDTEINASLETMKQIKAEIAGLGINIKTLVDEIRKTKGVPETEKKEEKKPDTEVEDIIKKQLEDEKGK